MSNVVFPFTISRPHREAGRNVTRGTGLGGEVLVRRNEIPDTPGWVYVAAFDVRLPLNGQTIDDWDDFVEAREGAKDTFLYKAVRKKFRDVTAEAVGTGDGSNKVFTLDKKHIDASTLDVYVDGVLQTLTTHYTFSLNNTTPTITFVTAPGSALAVTADYEFYMPVRFTEDPPDPDQRAGGTTSATIPHVIRGLRISEEKPGAHLV